MNDPDTKHEVMRRRFWMNMAIATAASSNCSRLSAPVQFADHALKEFDKRFPLPLANEKTKP